jgi:hypothetical protein
MLKRLIPIGLIVLIALAVILYFTSNRQSTGGGTISEAMKVIPDDAVWIIESSSVPELLKALVQADPLFPAIQHIGNIQPSLLALRKIDSLITRDSRFKKRYAHQPVVFSFHQTGKSIYQFLIIMENQGTMGASDTGELFAELSGRQGQWSQRIYNGQQIHRITFGVDALIPGISLAENSKYLIISPSPILLENSVRQLDQKDGLYSTSSFSKLARTSGKNALAHIYINLKAFPGWLGGWMNPAVKKKMEMFTRYGDWASMDLAVRNDAFWLNGFALEGDTLNSYLNLFKNQEPGKLDAELFLPSNTAAYYTIGVEKPAPFLRALADYLGSGEAGRKRQRLIEKAKETTEGDVVKTWIDLEYSQLTIGYLSGVADETTQPVALVSVKNGNQSVEKLITLPGKESAPKSLRKAPPKKIFKDDNLREYPIYEMPYVGLPVILGGSFFSPVSGKYFSCIGNVILLTDDVTTMEEILHKYSVNKTLAHDAVYLSLAGLMSTRSNVTFFAIPYKSKPILTSIMNRDAVTTFLANDQFLTKTGAVGLQFNTGSGMSLHNFFASFAEIDYSKPQTIWESKLDARVAIKPTIVTNHITQDKEIIVQDELSNLYLINSSGRILWKKSIGERIVSEIFQIDVMKNGRLQYLFSTGNAIHLLDRNGAYLPKYPVKLKLPATNAMALVDFDRTRDYRILIACTDNKIYAFDKNGNPVKGWSQYQASDLITNPVQHFKIQNKDYLVCNDPLEVIILDRKGAVKVHPDKDFAISSNSQVQFEDMASGKGPHFICTDVDGLVHTIYLDGTVESRPYGEFSPDHFFKSGDVNNDGLNEFLFFDRNKMEIFRQSGEKLSSRKYDGNLTAQPEIYPFENNIRKIGFFLPSSREILLYSGDGSLYNGFPLYGQTAFSIGNLGKSASYRNLLVGSNEAYLFNYAIK